MRELLLISASFPTAIFTVLLLVSMLYWITAMFGFVEIDALDIDMPDADSHMSLNSQSEHGFAESFSGLLNRLGLNGVPVTIIVTLIALIGWAISSLLSRYFGVMFGYGWIRYLTGVPILLGSFYISVMATAQVIKPLRKMFNKLDQNVLKKILGQIAVVRSSRVDDKFGEVFMGDGGAGLILKARSKDGRVFVSGDKVIMLEYDAAKNIYTVVSESDFLGAGN